MNSFLSAIAPETNSIINDLARLCESVEVGRGVPTAPVLHNPILKFKYVIIRATDIETAIIVPAFAQHIWGINQDARRAISAGFAWRDASGIVHVEGESVSLKLKSRPEDAEIIRETLFMNGL